MPKQPTPIERPEPADPARRPERDLPGRSSQHILEAVQRRLDEHPEKMRQRRETVAAGELGTTDHATKSALAL
jgi:hypothetical protein